MKMTPRFMTVAAVGTVLALSGCGSSTPNGAAQDTGSAGQKTSITMAGGKADPANIVPQQDNGSPIGLAMCENLVGPDEMGNPVLRAAKAIESTDAKNITVTLNEGRTWQDGTKITAKDWVESWNFTAFGPNAIKGKGTLQRIAGFADVSKPDSTVKEMSGLKVIDDSTFELTLSTPVGNYKQMLSNGNFCPIPPAARASLDAFTAYDKLPNNGNGPYKFDKYEHGQYMSVVRWDDFKGTVDKQAPTEAILRVVQDEQTSLRELAAGNINMIRNLTNVKTAEGIIGNDKVWVNPLGRQVSYIVIPKYLGIDASMGKAMSMATDRDTLTKTILGGGAAPARDFIAPQVTGVYRENACGEFCKFDLDAAKAELAKSASKDTTIEINYVGGGDTDTYAQALQNMWLKAGIKATLKPMTAPQRAEAANSGTLTGPVVQLWGSPVPDAGEYLRAWSVGGDGNKITGGYDNSEATEFMNQGAAALDPKDSAKLWQQADDLLFDAMPAFPVYYPTIAVGHSPCLEVGNDKGSYPAGFYLYKTTCTKK